MTSSPPPLGTPPPLKKRSGNKGWLTAALILVLLIGLSVLFVPLMLKLDTRDLPEPPDDGDLLVRADPIPDEENAFHFYILAANATQVSEADIDRLYEFDESSPEYGAVLEDLHAKNEEAFEYYHRALAAPHAQAPIILSYEEDTGLDNAPTEDLLHLVYLRIRQRFLAGEQARALSDALDLALLGRKLMDSGGITYLYLEASDLHYYGLETFIDLIGEATGPSAELRPFGARIDVLYDDGSGLAAALRAEYPLLVTELEGFAAASFENTEDMPDLMRALAEAAARQSANVYQINRMKTELTESLRPLIADAHLSLNAMRLDALQEEGFGIRDGLSAVSPAGLSRLMVQSMLPFLRDSIEAKCDMNTLTSVARAKLALKIHHLEHGAIPQSLDELIPELLTAVPLDDFDGQAIRYDAQRQLLYSVGLDFVDTGGSDPELGYEAEDPAWALDFANAEP